MEAHQLEAHLSTVWEAKERTGLLNLETDEWRDKRLVAEDPSTTAAKLTQLAGDIEIEWERAVKNAVEMRKKTDLLTQALAAHPNTPPGTLIALLDRFSPAAVRGLCANPVAPFLVLEMPDFWHKMPTVMAVGLTRQGRLPMPVVPFLASHPSVVVSKSAQLHHKAAGELENARAAEEAIAASSYPAFAAATRLSTSSESKELVRLNHLRKEAILFPWMGALTAALHLPLSDKPFPTDAPANPPESPPESWSRSPLDLLNHLAHDGNRLVRWAAQTRLADLTFTFTWHEGSE